MLKTSSGASTTSPFFGLAVAAPFLNAGLCDDFLPKALELQVADCCVVCVGFSFTSPANPAYPVAGTIFSFFRKKRGGRGGLLAFKF